MKLEDYEKLRNGGHYEPLWFELLNASGFAGCLPNGNIVDRRYYPEAYPIKENSFFGVNKPKEVQNIKRKDD